MGFQPKQGSTVFGCVPLLPTRIRSGESHGVGGYVLRRIDSVHSSAIFSRTNRFSSWSEEDKYRRRSEILGWHKSALKYPSFGGSEVHHAGHKLHIGNGSS
jgi:hypothetical protein